MTTRLRLVAWNVQPVLMLDDGENLTSVQVGAISIPAVNWEKFKNGGDEQALAELREQALSQIQVMSTTPAPTFRPHKED